MWSPEIQYEHFTNDFINNILSVFSEGVVNIEIDYIHSTVIAIIQQSLEYQNSWATDLTSGYVTIGPILVFVILSCSCRLHMY